ncbi:MAG: hypothetical protein KKB51_20270 [Candidatus Riflebacteria bacterium]|nr:hypothetical protein [Candidatus Riflebacteria bacterium]
MFDQAGRYVFQAEQPDIDALKSEFASYKAIDKLLLLREVDDEELVPWNSAKAMVAAIRKSGLKNILDFIANYPACEGKIDFLDLFSNSSKCEALSPGKISSRSFFPDLAKRLMNELGIDDQLLGGWSFNRDFGRIDEDTTWSSFECVFETQDFFVFVKAYQETLH